MLLPCLPALTTLPLLSKLTSNYSPLPCSPSLVSLFLLPTSSLQISLQLLYSAMLLPCLHALTPILASPNLPPTTLPCPSLVYLPSLPSSLLPPVIPFHAPLLSTYLNPHSHSYLQSLLSSLPLPYLPYFQPPPSYPPPVRPSRQGR